jgi:hypothetical protein
VKFHQLPAAVAQPTDTPEMRTAIALLKAADIDVRRPGKSRHQLKLDERTNYYPSKGTFYIDGTDGASPQRGLPALKAWIAEHS